MYYIFKNKSSEFSIKYESEIKNITSLEVKKGESLEVYVDAINRKLILQYVEGSTMISELPLYFKNLQKEDALVDLDEGIYILFFDKILINNIRWYRVSDIPFITSITQILYDNIEGKGTEAGVDSYGGLHIHLNQVLKKKQYRELLKNWFYVEFHENAFYSNIKCLSTARRGFRCNLKFASDIEPYKDDEKIDLIVDETKSIASLITALEKTFACKYVAEFENIPDKGEFIYYRTRQETAGGTIHMTAGPNVTKMHYGTFEIQFWYCNQDIRKILDFRTKYLASELPINKMTGYDIPLNDEEGNIVKGVVHWQRDNVSDNSVESRQNDNKLNTNLPQFEFSATIYTPLIIVPKEFIDPIESTELVVELYDKTKI